LKSRSNASQVADFLEKQNQDIYDQLNKSESDLKNYMEKEANVVMGDAGLLKQKVSNLQSQLEQNEIDYQQTVISLNAAKDQLSKIVPKASEKFSSVDDLYILELQKVIAKAEAERDISMIVSSDVASDPHYQDEYKKRNETIANLRKVLNERTQAYIDKSLEGTAGTSSSGNGAFNEIPTLTNQIMNYQYKLTSLDKTRQMLRENLNKYSAKLSQLPSQNLELDALTREKNFYEQSYLSTSSKLQDAVLAEKSNFGTIKLLDKAGISNTPISPNVQMNIMLGGVFGLTLGIILAFVFNSIFNIVHSPKDIEYLGFRLLTSVPKLQIRQGEERKLLVEPETSSSSLNTKSAEIYESYLRLGLNLSYNKKLKSLLITSAAPGAGKSSTAINLAITMANLGNKVLLVDTDLRKPVVHKYFNKSTAPGLTDYLLGQKESEDIIQATQFKGLDIITCGGRLLNPAFILTAPRMQNFTPTFGAIYDLVIFDSPPVNPVTDAIQLAKQVDEVVLVARADKTSADALKNANKVLKQLDINVGGVVLNDFDAAKAPFYTDYGRYSYYSDIEQEQAGNKKLLPRDKSKKSRFFKKEKA
jgi:tyrosine-protein kinase Etk/Wzc